MQSNIKEFEENAMSSMQKKQGTLLDPLLDKIQKAIDVVAAENGYTYIFNSASTNNTAIILFAKNEEDNISDLVLKKLGITAPKPNTTGGTNTTTPTNTGTNTNTNPGSNTSTAPVKKK
jgi:outer membrane protein